MSKLYTIMKDGQKIKTARSLNVAKELADQEQAEVFCEGEKIYAPVSDGLSGQLIAEETHAPVTEETDAPDAPEVEAEEEIIEPAKPAEPAKADKKPTDKKPTDKTPSDKSSPDVKFTVYRLKSLMNVREAPSLNAPRLRTAPKGTLVQVIYIENDWLKIKDGSNFAYILYKNGEFAEKVQNGTNNE